MKKKIKKIILLFVVPSLLIVVAIIGSLFFNPKYGFSVIAQPHSSSEILNSPQGLLLKGKSVEGEFIAKENYLGQVMLQFKEFAKNTNRLEDILVFKLKEKGEKEWYFTGTYKARLFENSLYFPFGFPPIENSRGKTYVFVFTSLYGNEENAIEVDKNSLNLTTAYQFPRSEILKSKKDSFDYLTRKISTSVVDVHFLLSSTFFLVPLLIYIMGFLYFRKFKNRNLLPSLFVLGMIFINIYFFKEINVGILVFLIICWIFVCIVQKLESSVSFAIAFILIPVWTLLTYFHINNFKNELNVWVYSFLVIGLIQAVLEEKRSIKNRIGYKKFFKKIFKLNEKL